ncbi:M14 family metallopeptidase [Reyranella sp. CPCC 100927]|uniref:M14 family metallopeptidase n=1 Tax=Reyranella sp. CPCC 100927 TaxID=2599616 RepID=UPI0011B54D16|nr:M14 family metallopeptidase [Reyranella sp. CPCC 100927]TWS99420.1 DUF2817 domain-containing protein [Reyranella sp. CPCC 100927]
MQYHECFAAAYKTARGKFLAAARAAQGDIRSFTHPEETAPDGGPLAIDVACFGDRRAPRQALIVSGTHGQEGFSGSAVQVGWLKSGGAAKLADGVGVVLVHGLNPYGFAHFTRTTENNVDLNRNFIDRSNGAPDNRHYETLHGDLVLAQWTEAENARVDAALERFTAAHGPDVLFDTLARGQYRHPDGLIFGGTAREWSNHTLETVVAETLAGAERVAFIDWHTGIGDYGKPFFLSFNEPSGPLFARACQWWGRENIDGVRPHGMEHPKYTGLVFHGVQRFLGDRPMCGAVVEFGTRGLGMRRVLRLDQWLRRQSDLDPDLRAMLQADMMDAFCPYDGSWRQATLNDGITITDQMLTGLAAWRD